MGSVISFLDECRVATRIFCGWALAECGPGLLLGPCLSITSHENPLGGKDVEREC